MSSILLEEIGNTLLRTQAKLLRLRETKQFVRIDGNLPQPSQMPGFQRMTTWQRRRTWGAAAGRINGEGKLRHRDALFSAS